MADKMHRWEVKKDSETKCYGDSLESLPTDDVLATLRSCGYKVFVDGKLYKEQKKGRQKSK